MSPLRVRVAVMGEIMKWIFANMINGEPFEFSFPDGMAPDAIACLLTERTHIPHKAVGPVQDGR